VTLDEFNALPEIRAADVFGACCGSKVWVSEMVSRRPYGSLDEMLAASDKAWSRTNENDWHEAFAHHPRIGDRLATGWPGGEQSRVLDAAEGEQEALAEVNRAYEERFGHIYIVCASGRKAAEMLADARGRIKNDSATELRVAAAEQHKITQLRLRKLLGERA